MTAAAVAEMTKRFGCAIKDQEDARLAQNRAAYRRFVCRLVDGAELAKEEINALATLTSALKLPADQPARDVKTILQVRSDEASLGADPRARGKELDEVLTRAIEIHKTKEAEHREARAALANAKFARRYFGERKIEIARIRNAHPWLFADKVGEATVNSPVESDTAASTDVPAKTRTRRRPAATVPSF
jgi:hypothetical protein